MYAQYFRFHESPFSLTPDPYFVYMSRRHREALAHLLYGAGETGGFVQLTGEVGTGKTTIVRLLLEQLPAEVDVALVLNPRLTVVEFLATICDELGVVYHRIPKTPKALVDLLNIRLLEAHCAGRRTILIIDEAQNLSVPVLEQVRLLTNLETTKHKLLQIFLIGQPELGSLLSRKELRQVAQRITARYHLLPLRPNEMGDYIRHRLKVAGARQDLFTEGAIRRIYRRSGGVPRLINILCDRALLGAYARDLPVVNARTVNRAAEEVMGRGSYPVPSWLRVGVPLAVASMLLSVVLWDLGSRQAGPEAGEPLEPLALIQDVSGPEQKRYGQPESTPASLPEGAAGSRDPEPILAHREQAVSAGQTLTQWLGTQALATGTEQAFARLLKIWGVASSPSAAESVDQCAWARGQRLQCLYEKGGWRELAEFNRPALIELRAGQERHQVVVQALSGDGVTLDFGTVVRTFPQAEVDPLWDHAFLLLWRPPLEGVATIAPGQQGNAVIWLRRQFARLDDMELLDRPSEVFDETLKARVLSFQQRRGLSQDGIVGPQTFIHLASALAGLEVPRLATP